MENKPAVIDFGDFDLPHLGVLCERIRRARGLIPEDVARHCGVSNETISRNIERWGKGSRKVFKGYVEALSARRVNGVRVEQPLTSQEASLLLDLFEQRRKTGHLQCQLAGLDFEIIKSGYRPPELNTLLETLQQHQGPAMIIDPLWFIHAVNGAALRLFGLSSDSPLLERWVGWHLLAARFRSDSPIRAAHQHTDIDYPLTVRFFFEDKMTYLYLFTLQMRLLLSKLNNLSQQHRFNFTKWWLLATKFNLPFDREPLLRTIVFNNKQIRIEAGSPKIDQNVRFNPASQLTYRLIGWSPANKAGQQVFEVLHSFADCQKIYFAADYDHNRAFHVNCWPEVREHIETWIRTGDC